MDRINLNLFILILKLIQIIFKIFKIKYLIKIINNYKIIK